MTVDDVTPSGPRDLPVPAGLEPAHRQALMRHGRMELDAGRLDAALDAACALTVLDPLFAGGWRLLAEARRAAGHEQEAMAATRVAQAMEEV